MLIRALFLICFSIISGKVFALNIVTTIPPLASMVIPLLSEEDRLTVLLTPGQTPHGFQLKPSHMMAIEKADLILSVGSGVDSWAHKAVSKYPEKQLVMAKLPGLVKLQMRSHANWKIKLIEPKNLVKKPHHHESLTHDKAHRKMDPHVWLSPDNAVLFVRAFGATYLAQKASLATKVSGEVATDAVFEEKLTQFLSKIQQADLNIKQQFKPVLSQAHVVLHDAFQYFQSHYHLNGVGAIQVSPELKPSLHKIMSMQKTIQERGVVCVFKEPQFPDKQVNYLVRGMEVRVGKLDPLGGRIKNESYDAFIQTLANQFTECLSEPQIK